MAAPPSIEGYGFIKTLGSGGMGSVYLYRDTRLNRHVAVKQLHVQDDDQTRRYFREVQSLAMLRHDHITRIFDILPDKFIMIMEYVTGSSLEERIKTSLHEPQSQRVESAVRFAAQGVSALEYMHAQSPPVIHRDIKPANMLVDESGVLKVTDFGLVRFGERGNTITQAGFAMGTPGYMSPEQVDDTSRVGPQTDVYAMGCVLYFMAAGHHPFPQESLIETLTAQKYGRVLDPQRTIPDRLYHIISRAMEVDVKKRYRSAAEMLRDLTKCGVSGMPTLNIPPSVDPAATIATPAPSLASEGTDIESVGQESSPSREIGSNRKTPTSKTKIPVGKGRSTLKTPTSTPAAASRSSPQQSVFSRREVLIGASTLMAGGVISAALWYHGALRGGIERITPMNRINPPYRVGASEKVAGLIDIITEGDSCYLLTDRDQNGMIRLIDHPSLMAMEVGYRHAKAGASLNGKLYLAINNEIQVLDVAKRRFEGKGWELSDTVTGVNTYEGKILASLDRSLVIIDPASGEKRSTSTLPFESVVPVDGGVLMYHSDHSGRLEFTADGRKEYRIPGSHGGVVGRPDGSWIVTDTAYGLANVVSNGSINRAVSIASLSKGHPLLDGDVGLLPTMGGVVAYNFVKNTVAHIDLGAAERTLIRHSPRGVYLARCNADSAMVYLLRPR